MKFILSPSAIRDLQDISDYTLQTWGSEQEDRYLKGLWGKLAEIQSSPDSQQNREDLAKGCRSARHGKHVIFFSIKEQTLQIIRILHGAMDFGSHLKQMLFGKDGLIYIHELSANLLLIPRPLHPPV